MIDQLGPLLIALRNELLNATKELKKVRQALEAKNKGGRKAG